MSPRNTTAPRASAGSDAMPALSDADIPFAQSSHRAKRRRGSWIADEASRTAGALQPVTTVTVSTDAASAVVTAATISGLPRHVASSLSPPNRLPAPAASTRAWYPGRVCRGGGTVLDGDMTRISIVTGPIRSGKTTRLAAWARGRDHVAGLLSPDAPGGRVFVDLASGAMMAMERPDADEPVLAIGRFRFRAASFDWANARLAIAAADAGDTTIVVDEVGPLELAGSGLRPGLAVVLARRRGRAILVVREHLVDAVRQALDLDHADVVAAVGW